MEASMHIGARNQTSKSIFLGRGTYDAPTNVALDEAMAERSAKTGNTLLRLYDFQTPSIILCEFDSTECLKLDNIGDVRITRRMSSGRPIYVSSNVLCYAVSVPHTKIEGQDNSLRDVHLRYGSLAADAIAEVAGIDRAELTLPRTSSIRFDGKPIAGHAQHWVQGRSLLYHGIITVAPWDTIEIDRLWRLEKDDLNRIAQLPSVIGIAKRKLGSLEETKTELTNAIVRTLSGGDFVNSREVEMETLLSRAAQLSKETYGNMEWILRPDATRVHNSPFCILWEENETPKRRTEQSIKTI